MHRSQVRQVVEQVQEQVLNHPNLLVLKEVLVRQLLRLLLAFLL